MRLPRSPHLSHRLSQRRRQHIDGLEARRLLAAPTIGVSDVVTVPAGKTLQVPIIGADADGDSLSYSVSAGSGVSGGFRAAKNTWLDLATSKGTMRFQLFDDLAPNTVRKIRGLVEAGFYNGLKFHQIVTNTASGYRFAIGGDPKGDGTGGPDFRFEDEFNKDAIFSGTGQLAMINGDKKDNNGSQFFVTGATARAFDFNSTIFGQIVRGTSTLESILAAPKSNAGTPTSAITITSASIVENKTDAVMQLRAGTGVRTTSVTVTASDGRGGVVSRTISVNVVNDNAHNTPPILQPLPRVITAAPGERFSIQISAFDLENDPWDVGANILANGGGLEYIQLDLANKRLVVEAKQGFSGPITFKVGVRTQNSPYRGAITIAPGEPAGSLTVFDTQVITVAVGGRPIDAGANAIAHYPAVQFRDKLVARFTSQDASLNKNDFEASVDWGDGTVVQDAKIESIGNGAFGVFGTHTYARAGTLPLAVTIESENGASTTVESSVYINNPYALNGSTLVIRGTDEDDNVKLDVNGALLDFSIGNYAHSFDLGAVKAIDIQLFNGNDRLDSGSKVGMPSQRIDAGSGNDTIYAGSGHDYVVGGNGHDILVGNGGNDTILGGDGNDSIQSGSGKNLCYGDAGNDRITGSGGRDTFDGGADSDRLYGRGGDDYLDGGAGTDRLYGEDGNNTLIGGASNDRMYGGSGNDLFFGKGGVDYIFGNGGIDRRGDNDPNDVLTDVI